MTDVIPGFEGFSEKFSAILSTPEWLQAQLDFNEAKLVLTAGNGGNLAVCDHGAIDIARLTDKQAMAPGSGILASSLINDASHDLWVKNWLSIATRGHTPDFLSKMMLIGVSSSGFSANICMALDLALQKGMKALLITATKPQIPGSYNTIILNVDQYHTSEVITLALFYQLIHGAGFVCPTISDSTARQVVSDYTR